MLIDEDALYREATEEGDPLPSPAAIAFVESVTRDVVTSARGYVSPDGEGGVRIEWPGEKGRVVLSTRNGTYLWSKASGTIYRPATRERLVHCLLRSEMLILPE